MEQKKKKKNLLAWKSPLGGLVCFYEDRNSWFVLVDSEVGC